MGCRALLDLRSSAKWHSAFLFFIFFPVNTCCLTDDNVRYHRYGHGFLFPSEIARVREGVRAFFDRQPNQSHHSTPSAQNRNDWGLGCTHGMGPIERVNVQHSVWPTASQFDLAAEYRSSCRGKRHVQTTRRFVTCNISSPFLAMPMPHCRECIVCRRCVAST